MGFVKFMVTGMGRAVRVVAGVALVVVGLVVMGGTGGLILAVVGLVPLLAGLFDVCVFAPLFGLPFLGKQVRGS